MHDVQAKRSVHRKEPSLSVGDTAYRSEAQKLTPGF